MSRTRVGIKEALGYRPNHTARSLASGKTGLLALAVSSPAGMPHVVGEVEYFMQLMSSASAAALEHGYALVLAPASPEADAWQRINPDGAIVVDPIPGDPLLAHLEANGVKTVTTGRDPFDDKRGLWVDNDHQAGATAMFGHLSRRGARRIALLSSEPVHSYVADIRSAYHEWCAAAAIEPTVVTAPGTPTEGAGYEAAAYLLDRTPRPDAIYATLDRLALGAILAARARGIDVPRELLVAGCSDSEASRKADPALTVLNLHPDQIARTAVEILLDLLEGREPSRGRVIPTRVIQRGSTFTRTVGKPGTDRSRRPAASGSSR